MTQTPAREGQPKITFGIIVLNGEPFTRYNLRSLYPHAHQIIVVEGACPGAAGVATPDGHSIDSTLESVHDFKRREDPEDKVLLVTAEEEGHPDGFWPGEKDEQSRAYARRATGEWLWQIDVDEFYHERHMQEVLSLLAEHPETTAVSFQQLCFWGSLSYACTSWAFRPASATCHRIFRWGPGYSYRTHRPPTVVDPDGRDLRQVRWVSRKAMERRGIYMYHYPLLFPSQVRRKGSYYREAVHSKSTGWERWMTDCYFALRKPYRVHNLYEYPSWLWRFRGEHPSQVEHMWGDIREGRLSLDLRPNEDIERLLNTWWYPLGRLAYKLLDPLWPAGSFVCAQASRVPNVPGKLWALLSLRRVREPR